MDLHLIHPDERIEAAMRKDLGLPEDWEYRDLPRLSPEFMRKFKELVGEENIRWITFADYGDSQRGQLMVSPEGLRRIKVYNDARENERGSPQP